MTVYVPESRAEFLGNGVATQFDFNFRFFSDSNIRVTRVDADGMETVLSAGYSLSGAGSLNGGSVIITSPVLATGERLIVERILQVVQETDIRNQGSFFPEIHEDVFDYLTMLIQQYAGGLRQAIRVAVSDPEPARLPKVSSRANMLMGFNSSGDPVPVSPVSGSASDLALQLLNAIDPAKGAAMIGYRGRTVHARLDDTINVKDYGAVGDGVTDDTEAFEDAIAAALALDFAEITIPAGKYILASVLNIAMSGICGLNIRGAGSDNTELRWTAAGGTDGINVTTGDDNWWMSISPSAQFGIRGVSIVTTAESAGVGLTLNFNADTGRPHKKVMLDDVVFRGHSSFDHTWLTATRLVDTSSVFFNACRWFLGGPGVYTATGVSIEGSVGGDPSGFYFSHCEAFYGSTWINAGNNIEGIYLTNCSHVAGGRALVWGAGAESGLHVIGGHYNNNITNFDLNGVFDFELVGALLYCEGHGANDFAFIGLNNGARFTIQSNVFVGTGTGGEENGILVNSSAGTEAFGGLISGNAFNGLNGTAIVLGAPSQYITVGENSYRGVLARVTNASSLNALLARTFSKTEVINTPGGTTTVTVNIAVPHGFFLNKPESATMNSSTDRMVGYYDFDASTATNLVFLLTRNDGATIPAYTIRLSVTAFGSDA